MSLISKIYNSPQYLDEAYSRKQGTASKKAFSWAKWRKARKGPKTTNKSTLPNKVVK